MNKVDGTAQGAGSPPVPETKSSLRHSPRLWVKLLVAFVIVAASAVGVAAVMANRITTRQFEIYVSQGKQARAERLAPEFAVYYARTGSWDGVDEWWATLAQEPSGSQGHGARAGSGNRRRE